MTINLIANFVGKGWVAITYLVLVPVYVRLLGIEAYGLIGISSVLQSLVAILDMGLSTTINRELARHSIGAGREQEMRDLVRTLEVVYWAVACLIGALIWQFSGVIAHRWVNAQTLPEATIHSAVLLMGLSAAAGWPITLYTGGLMGLQRQVLFNAVNVPLSTVRSVGAALVALVSPQPVLAFFGWQLLMSVISVAVIAFALWRSLPAASTRACFRPAILRSVWRFAAGTSAVSLAILLFTHLDKIILSRMLPLTSFGYYTLAWQIAGSLYLLYNPIYTVLFPVFSQKAAGGDDAGLRQTYHWGCQLASVVMLPPTVVIALFSYDVLLVWTRDAVTASNTSRLVTLLMIGACLSALLYLPYALQLAFGQTRYILYTLLVALLVLLPTIVVLTVRYGAVGAAGVWTAVNLVQVAVAMHFTDRRFIPGERKRWFLVDVGRPMLAVLGVAGAAKWLGSTPMSVPLRTGFLLAVLVLSLAAAAVATPATLAMLKRFLPRSSTVT